MEAREEIAEMQDQESETSKFYKDKAGDIVFRYVDVSFCENYLIEYIFRLIISIRRNILC